MEETTYERRIAPEPVAARVTDVQRSTLICGRDLEWYLLVTKSWIVALSCAGVVFIIAHAFNVPGASVMDGSLFIIKTFCFIWIGSKVSGRYREPLCVAACAGGLAGIGAGVVLAFARFVFIQHAWTLFNLITEPVITGAIGAGMAYIGGLASARLPREASREESTISDQ